VDIPSIFNGFVMANVLHAFNDLDLFRAFDGGAVHESALLQRAGGHRPGAVQFMLRLMRQHGLVEETDAHYRLTDAGIEARKNIGFFTWGVGGYGDLLRNASAMVDGSLTQDLRDGRFVAKGSNECNHAFIKARFDELMRGLSPRLIFDMKYDNADRLTGLLEEQPAARGVGVDISAGAIEEARREISARGLEARITVERMNVVDLLDNAAIVPGMEQADTVMCFLMMHDLLHALPRASLMSKLRKAFPRMENLVVADTLQPDPGEAQDVFINEFLFAHALMGIKIWEKSDYDDLLSAPGFRLKQSVKVPGIPGTYLFHAAVV